LNDPSKLSELGWSPHWEALYEAHAGDDSRPGRVVRVDRGSSLVATADGVLRARTSARLLKSGDGMPVVGDWVQLLSPADLDVPLVDFVLERRSAITRGDSGKTSGTQVLAANIDVVFVVHPIDEDPNLRRIERELALAWGSGALPVVVLTKSDLAEDPDETLATVESTLVGVDVFLVNAQSAESARQLLPHLSGNSTGVLIGPSGAGKSTLINSMLGEGRQATGDVREVDGKGRHTTVARELIQLPGQGIIIDTPGLRAVALTGSDEGIALAFPDIEEIAAGCRFRDCRHDQETGCAVKMAVESGALPGERLISYHKLIREAEVAAMKSDANARAAEKRKGKILAKGIREFHKRNERGD